METAQQYRIILRSEPAWVESSFLLQLHKDVSLNSLTLGHYKPGLSDIRFTLTE